MLPLSLSLYQFAIHLLRKYQNREDVMDDVLRRHKSKNYLELEVLMYPSWGNDIHNDNLNNFLLQIYNDNHMSRHNLHIL